MARLLHEAARVAGVEAVVVPHQLHRLLVVGAAVPDVEA
jgi:hypothetical protein